MSEITKQEGMNLTLSEKLRMKKNLPCLLLDVSGSMSGLVDIVKKIDILRDILISLKGYPKMYKFSSVVSVHKNGDSLIASGDTRMAPAFNLIKFEGHKKVILVTDGIASDPLLALEAAKGLEIQILYIGPEPKPDFLDKLASKSGSFCTQEDLRNPKELTNKIQLLLGDGRKAIQL